MPAKSGLSGKAGKAGKGAPAAVAAPVETGPDTRLRLRRLGLASLAGLTAAFLAVEAANGLPTSHLTSAERPDHLVASAPLTQAAVVRDQAAAWLASEVGAGAIVSCDPVMCAVLVRHGFPAANLLVLGPGAPDPLGSGVVLATPAVRSMFGSRLATVYAPQTLASFGTRPSRCGSWPSAVAVPGPVPARRCGRPSSPPRRRPRRPCSPSSRAQRPPYLAARSGLSRGALSIEFTAPGPLGLLQSPP